MVAAALPNEQMGSSERGAVDTAQLTRGRCNYRCNYRCDARLSQSKTGHLATSRHGLFGTVFWHWFIAILVYYNKGHDLSESHINHRKSI